MKLKKSTIALTCLAIAYFVFVTINYVTAQDNRYPEPQKNEAQQEPQSAGTATSAQQETQFTAAQNYSRGCGRNRTNSETSTCTCDNTQQTCASGNCTEQCTAQNSGCRQQKCGNRNTNTANTQHGCGRCNGNSANTQRGCRRTS